MSSRGLTISIIFRGESLNYGEGVGNLAELKKLSRGDGRVYTYASRQALRYDIARIGNKLYDWNLDVVNKDKGTVQFAENCTIENSQEMDLFGYMKTKKKGANEEDDEEKSASDVRTGPVRISHAIALEVYKSDMDFLNNKGLADRIGEFPNLANVEEHMSYYTYTITIDLEKIGVDKNIELPKEEKIKRVNQLLEIIKVLNRDIRGREENLSPLFVIGGMYKLNSPFFLGRIKLDANKGQYSINTNILEDTVRLKIGEENIFDNTKIGLVKDIFSNQDEIQKLFEEKCFTIQEFFENLEKQVEEYYTK